jgi:hypothetical protein
VSFIDLKKDRITLHVAKTQCIKTIVLQPNNEWVISAGVVAGARALGQEEELAIKPRAVCLAKPAIGFANSVGSRSRVEREDIEGIMLSMSLIVVGLELMLVMVL